MNQVAVIARHFINGFNKQTQKELKLKIERQKIIDKLKKSANPELQEKIKRSENLAKKTGILCLCFIPLNFLLCLLLNTSVSDTLIFNIISFISIVLTIFFVFLFRWSIFLNDTYVDDFKKELDRQIKEKTKDIDKKLEKCTDWNAKVDFEQYFTAQIQMLRDHGSFDEEAIRKFAEKWLELHNKLSVSKQEMRSLCLNIIKEDSKEQMVGRLHKIITGNPKPQSEKVL